MAEPEKSDDDLIRERMKKFMEPERPERIAARSSPARDADM